MMCQGKRKHTNSRFVSVGTSPQRHVHKNTDTLYGALLCSRNAQSNLFESGWLHRYLLLRSTRIPSGVITARLCVIQSVHKAVGNGVRADTEWPPAEETLTIERCSDVSLCEPGRFWNKAPQHGGKVCRGGFHDDIECIILHGVNLVPRRQRPADPNRKVSRFFCVRLTQQKRLTLRV
ncbi:hypothetical protein M405DRAFT_223992 [Rhizopogon salebrosus TDB-379]|nr:hypothetical protein M405DRAFT_223992 [Rhizopogon salebrosus TDB-379]